MKLPRDLPGNEVAKLLARHYGYQVTRCQGSHMTVALSVGTKRHRVTVPRHRVVRVGTLSAITADVAKVLGLSKREVLGTLFR